MNYNLTYKKICKYFSIFRSYLDIYLFKYLDFIFLNWTDLRTEGSDPNNVEDGVGEYTRKHVPLAVDHPGVDLVEEGHHHEGVEDDGEVNTGGVADAGLPPRVDVQDLVSWWGRIKY